ncbi:MAG: (2Fe-2S)-binding protein [Desulfobacterales bacterium]|jgi:carbon-monoxide dehydrogenase small subunit|nr:MAG: (2Fe-2S)-binding protein [Desulfobacterales bacterium]
MSREIAFVFNGNKMNMAIEDHWTLLHLIREELGYTGTKEGCGSGECGACTVIVDGNAVNSCLYLAAEIDGKELMTIEGLASPDGTLHPIQKAFVENGGIQCGFCSPGMIISAKALLDENPNANEEEIKEAIAGNLCRCTGYVQIVDSIKSVSGHEAQEPHVVAFRSEEGDRGD